MRQPVSFGKYLLLGRISVGGMAEVFKAKTYGVQGFEKIIAIKRILPALSVDEEFITMFIDEAKIAGQLAHANIGQIHELGEIDGSHFIAMEFVWGRDLLQFQNRHKKHSTRISMSAGAFILMGVCDGLNYAHRKRDVLGVPMEIVHRDCSPQNVVISFEGEVKLIDFGIAKAASKSSQTNAGVLKGKFGYMSPEQVRGLPLDRRSDIFSLGTMLFEVLVGKRLFDGESDFAILEKVRNVEIDRQAMNEVGVPDDLQAIVLKALSRNVTDRYQWCSEMRDDLRTFLQQGEEVYSYRMLGEEMRAIFSEEFARETKLMELYGKIGPDGLPAEEETFEQLVTAPTATPPPPADDPPAVRALVEEAPLTLLEEDASPDSRGGLRDDTPDLFAPPGTGSLALGIEGPGEGLELATAEDLKPAEIFGELEMAGPAESGSIEPPVSTPTIDVADLFGEDVAGGVGGGSAAPLMGTQGSGKVVLADASKRVPSASALVASLPTLGGGSRRASGTEQIQRSAIVTPRPSGTGVTGGHSVAALQQKTDELPLRPSSAASVTAGGAASNKWTLVIVASAVVSLALGLFFARGLIFSPSSNVASPPASLPSSLSPKAAESPGLPAEPLASPTQPSLNVQGPAQSAGSVGGATESGHSTDNSGQPKTRDQSKSRGASRHRARAPAVTSGSKGKVTGPGYFLPWTKPWARVHIDGKDTGKVSPVAPSKKISLAPGKHIVTFVVKDKEHKFAFVIESGKTTKLSKILKP